jgi:hypothetical protein
MDKEDLEKLVEYFELLAEINQRSEEDEDEASN